jgi:hypothetical protein
MSMASPHKRLVSLGRFRIELMAGIAMPAPGASRPSCSEVTTVIVYDDQHNARGGIAEASEPDILVCMMYLGV